MSVEVPELSKAERSYLKQLGLSDHEEQVYKVLLASGKPLSAQDIASKVMIFPNAVYRIFKALEHVGLIRSAGRRPIRYEAIDKERGFNAAYLQRKNELERALRFAGNPAKGQHSQTYTIIGRKPMYEEYIRLANSAQKSIEVFAIGIAFSKALFTVQKAAIERGVYIRHAVQQRNPRNYHIIHKWQQLGVKVRYFHETRGFHITLIDKSIAMITFSDSGNTEDRFSVITQHPLAVKMFQQQFESIWQHAQKIDIYK